MVPGRNSYNGAWFWKILLNLFDQYLPILELSNHKYIYMHYAYPLSNEVSVQLCAQSIAEKIQNIEFEALYSAPTFILKWKDLLDLCKSVFFTKIPELCNLYISHLPLFLCILVNYFDLFGRYWLRYFLGLNYSWPYFAQN